MRGRAGLSRAPCHRPPQAPVLQAASPTNPTAITPEEYFDPHFDLEARNIGRPIEVSSKVQR